MSVFTFVTPDMAFRPAPTIYSANDARFDKSVVVDEAVYTIANLVAVAQRISSEGHRVERADLTEMGWEEDYSTGERVRIGRPYLLATLYRSGETFEVVCDPNAGRFTPQSGLDRYWAELPVLPQLNPTWPGDPMEDVTARVATLFPYWGGRAICVSSEITPPDPAAFWTQFDKAVEVI